MGLTRMFDANLLKNLVGLHRNQSSYKLCLDSTNAFTDIPQSDPITDIMIQKMKSNHWNQHVLGL